MTYQKNLTTEVRSTKNEVINLKDVIIERLQDKNQLLCEKCNKLEKIKWSPWDHPSIKSNNMATEITSSFLAFQMTKMTMI